MVERGSNKHGPALDEQMKHEDQGLIQGSKPGHVIGQLGTKLPLKSPPLGMNLPSKARFSWK